MTSKEFITKLKAAAGVPHCYALGCFGQVITNSLIAQKSKQYPDWYKTNKSKLVIGAFGFDCICFIKAILWGWTPDTPAVYVSNGVPDVNEEAMLAYCDNVSTDFTNIEPGEYVWRDGHCGVYIGNGNIIHCTSKDSAGVSIIPLSQFVGKKHGKLKWVDYSQNKNDKASALEALEVLYTFIKEKWPE